MRRMRRTLALVAIWLSAAAFAGCGPLGLSASPVAGPPPIKLSVRKSKLPGQGLVVGVNNPTGQPIKVVAVFVKGKGEEEERSYRLDQAIKPLDSITVGWVQLDGWKLRGGDKLRILCEGYTEDVACELTD